MEEVGLLGCSHSHCITICCCESQHTHTQTNKQMGSGRYERKEITCARCAV